MIVKCLIRILSIVVLIVQSYPSDDSRLVVTSRALGIALDSWLGGGCIETMDGSTVPGTAIILGNCDDHSNGFIKSYLGGNSVIQFRLSKDKTKCMQVTNSGTGIRLQWCSQNPRQLFRDTRGGFSLFFQPSMCIHYEGTTPNITEKMIIKDCSLIEDGWSGDGYDDGWF